MPREPLSNMGGVCDECKLAPRPELYAHRPLESFIGKHVKLGFDTRPAPPEAKDWPKKEHMWVFVTGVEGKELIGILNNDPHFCDCEDGQGLAFTPEEIEAVLGEPEKRG